MNILDNEEAMAVLREARDKLGELGIPSMISPLSLPDPYGMTVSLHISSAERGLDAASVAQTEGGMVAYTEPKLFEGKVNFVKEERQLLLASLANSKLS